MIIFEFMLEMFEEMKSDWKWTVNFPDYFPEYMQIFIETIFPGKTKRLILK